MNLNDIDSDSISLYTTKEFCAISKMSKATFYRLLKNGIAPKIIRLENKILISKEAIKEWIKQREMVSNPIIGDTFEAIDITPLFK